MKQPRVPRTESPDAPAFKPGSPGQPAPARVNFRQQSLAASREQMRQLSTQPPAARRTFRVTVG
jgi:hypothetical protein